jgi:hypothetical protein
MMRLLLRLLLLLQVRQVQTGGPVVVGQVRRERAHAVLRLLPQPGAKPGVRTVRFLIITDSSLPAMYVYICASK